MCSSSSNGWRALSPVGASRVRCRRSSISRQALDVRLTRPVPVYFAYITAWAEPDGRVEFRPDIYGRDGNTAMGDVFDPDAPPPPSQGLAP